MLRVFGAPCGTSGERCGSLRGAPTLKGIAFALSAVDTTTALSLHERSPTDSMNFFLQLAVVALALCLEIFRHLTADSVNLE